MLRVGQLTKPIFGQIRQVQLCQTLGYLKDVMHGHMFVTEISTIKSHDRGKRGYFGNHKVISYHLQLTRGQGNYPFTYLMTLIAYEVNLLKV